MHLLRHKEVILIAILGGLLFIPFLGHVHLFDWDEINFAECSREMIVLQDYSQVYMDYQPFWEKPPLFFWLQSAAMHLFGVNEFAARFPNAICGILTLIVIFLCGRRIYDNQFGTYWALAFGGSLFPTFYFKSGLIDPWFNLFIFLSLYLFILYVWSRKGKVNEEKTQRKTFFIILSGLLMGVALLTKGPVALIIFSLVAGVYLALNRFKPYFNWSHILLWIASLLLIAFAWYGYNMLKNGSWFIHEFIRYQYRLFSTHDAGQKGFPGYHYVVLLFGCFPASVFAIRSFFKIQSAISSVDNFRKWMIILFWVVTILFSIVQSRIVHYSSLAWFPLSFLASLTIYRLELKKIFLKNWIPALLLGIGILISVLLIAIPFVGQNIPMLIPYVKDEFAKANMEAVVAWTGWESLPGFLFLVVIFCGYSLLKKYKYNEAAWTVFGGSAIVVFMTSLMIVPKIEQYSQRAAIDFFEEKQNENAYLTPLGYKSYAHLFYGKKTKPDNPNSYDIEWLLKGNIDKPVYFVSKVDRPERFSSYPELKELYRKNGFVFLKRGVPE